MLTSHPFYAQSMPHTATYWAPGAAGADGRKTFATAPVTMRCRWQYEQNIVRDDQGNEIVCEVVVYVNGNITEGGFMALGDYTAEDSPVTDAREVRRKKLSPDIGGTKQLCKAWL